MAATATMAARIVIWDAEPGVVLRTWWAPPWRNRHYFPSSGEKPEIGRDEDLSPAQRARSRRRNYRRSWSSSSANPGDAAHPADETLRLRSLVQPSLRWR